MHLDCLKCFNEDGDVHKLDVEIRFLPISEKNVIM